MAGAGSSLAPPPRLFIGVSKSTTVKFLRCKLSGGAPFTVRKFTSSHRHDHHALSACSDSERPCPVVSEGPSCIFVGPVESASQETLEALYRQAREAYYSGTPLILDDMFDKVELKLRWYGSKYVVKYPRCSLLRQSTYADAQEDPSQVFALASIWSLILVFGGSVCLVPILYTISQAFRDTFHSEAVFISRSSTLEIVAMFNCVFFMLLGSVIGCPIASASVRQLRGLWQNDLVALKGACPNCGEEVFAFVRSDQGNSLPHRADCHVCECLLEFRTKAEKSISKPGRRWVHGRVYLITDKRNRRRRIWT